MKHQQDSIPPEFDLFYLDAKKPSSLQIFKYNNGQARQWWWVLLLWQAHNFNEGGGGVTYMRYLSHTCYYVDLNQGIIFLKFD